MKKYSFFIKIFCCFLIAIIFTNFISTDIFIANTPRIRSNLLSYLKQKYITGTYNYFASLGILPYPKRFKNIEELQQYLAKYKNVPEVKIGKGVYAKDLGGDKIINIVTSEIQFKEITAINRKGQTVKIRLPSDTKVTQDFIDLIIN